MGVYLNRNFLLSYVASFISLFGSKLLMISYVAFVYGETGSATLASAVFAADWIANLFVGLLATRYIDRADARRLLVALNVVAAAVTLLFLAALSPRMFPLAVGVVFARALLNSAVNAARVKALVQFFDEEQTDTYSTVFNSSLFLAIAAAGAVGSFVLSFVDLGTVVLLDVATFLLSAVLFALVRPNRQRIAATRRESAGVKENVVANLRSAAVVIARSPVISSAVFYIVLAVTALQATYEVLITAVPELWFGMGSSGMAVFFTAEWLAVFAGVFVYQYLSRRGKVPERLQGRLTVALIGFATLMYAVLPLAQGSLGPALAVFVLLVFAGEVVWAHQYKRLISHSPDSRVSSVVGLLTAVYYSLMAVSGFAFSRGMDTIGVEWSIGIDVAVIAVLVVGWEYAALRRRRRPAPGSAEPLVSRPATAVPARPLVSVSPAEGRPMKEETA
ncbi:MFS transporter [Streptomyces sp. ISL-10]|uniref:MFS transporter n=1 Tax=Streptomyces sp. ISL-10 TaxID=2819172 RepID=UPI001BEC6C33|nr:MFS transporter [Streptomyces sp. ISL-10]MBT2364207.1 MFS transporter [Streptomyces sp. ISL-10]